MWAQEWTDLFDLMLPYVGVPSTNITATMHNKHFTVHRMFKLAESFFTSINLEPMTKHFWENSMFEQPTGKTVQ